MIAVQAQTGSTLEGDTFDFHFYPFSIQGYYEFRNVAIALALAAPGETIIEVGANVGTETVSFSDVVGPRGTVHAFEPWALNVRWLRRARELSRYKNIVVHECALGDTNTRASFSAPPERSSGTGHLLREGETASAVASVDVATLDTLRDVVGPAALVFVDIEGHEVQFLRGATGFLAKHRPALVLEASPKLLQRAGSTVGGLYATVREHGYTAYSVGRFRPWPVNPQEQRSAENWLCLPDERQSSIARVKRVLLWSALLPCIRGLNPLTQLGDAARH